MHIRLALCVVSMEAAWFTITFAIGIGVLRSVLIYLLVSIVRPIFMCWGFLMAVMGIAVIVSFRRMALM